jgi:syntaxin 1B/2/3
LLLVASIDFLVNPYASEQELEEAISENNSGSVFSQQVIGGAKLGEAQRTLNEVEARHQDIVRMAQSIEELQQMFMDLQSMVEIQDTLITNIGENTDNAAVYTEEAANQMTEAVKSRKSARKVSQREMAICTD